MSLTQIEQERNLELQSLFMEHSKKMFNVAYRISGSQADAEDIVQDVFVRLYFILDQFQGKSELTTWLYRITVNASLDKMRHFRMRRRQEARIPLALGHTKGEDKKLFQGEVTEKLMKALSKLPNKYRVVIILRDFEELSYEEIAKILRIGTGTIASRLNRGRIRLKKEMEQQGIDRDYLES